MTPFFQLARVRRSSPPSSSSFAYVEIPESARTILENLSGPLIVISYFACSRSVQDEMCTAAAVAAGVAGLAPIGKYKPDRLTTYEYDDTASMMSAPREMTTPNVSGSLSTRAGVWAWLSASSVALTDFTETDTPVRTLHLIYRDDGMSTSASAQHESGSGTIFHSLDKLLGPLFALCSTHLSIVSVATSDTEVDVTRLASSLHAMSTSHQHLRRRDRPSLSWRWCGHMGDTLQEVSGMNGHFDSESGLAALESQIMDSGNYVGSRTDHTEIATQLSILRQCFESVVCHTPAPPMRLNETEQGKPKQDMDKILAEDLHDLALTEKRGSRRCWTNTSWFHDMMEIDERDISRRQAGSGSTRILDGAVLLARLQACLRQLSNNPSVFDFEEWSQSTKHLIRERALYSGVHAYHRIMNEHLDRQPIPMPWHTLAMVHHDAQSKAQEEIETRYFHGCESLLPQLLREFRDHCLETTITGVNTPSVTTAAAATVVGSTSALEMMVPTGGLYLEYYSANASALQNHHLVTLDEHWQLLLKNRLMSTQSANSTLSSATLSPLTLVPSGSFPDIKDYPDFLLAVDHVRRSYLETCIPSPEALSVLENLDEMQQAESVLFLQSIINTAATSPSCTSPISLPTRLNRSVSISSSHQSIILVNGGIASGQGSNGNGGGDFLTDTLSGKSTSIQALASAGIASSATGTEGADGSAGGGSGAGGGAARASGIQAIHQQLEQAPTDLEQQFTEIMLAKRRTSNEDLRYSSKDEFSSSQQETPYRSIKERERGLARVVKKPGASVPCDAPNSLQETDNKAVVQFGWTLHMLHANTLQYAWIWTWLYAHEGSSRQNVVACDSKVYTASKWIILPAKDLIRTRKEWKVSYGDRVWLVSYWFSTRNAKMDLPEYLPRARGAPCRHIVPYGETYVICKTCPADVLCMRCFRASDHTDHTMYLQCSWGTSVCVCYDPLRLKANHALHCSLHSAESQRSYSGLAKGKPCLVKFKAGEKVYRCKSCATDKNESSVLCDRCFRSHNHFGHDVVAQIAEDGLTCSCQDSKSWKPSLHCAYHSLGLLETEYLPQPINAHLPALSPWVSLPKKESSSAFTSVHLEDNSLLVDRETEPISHNHHPPSSSESSTASMAPSSNRCGHIFQPGEDIYHCRDCSFNDMVVLCSRCFHGSACVNHRWRMGEYQHPQTDPGSIPNKPQAPKSSSQPSSGSKSEFFDDGDSGSLSVVINSFAITEGLQRNIKNNVNQMSLPVERLPKEDKQVEENATEGCGNVGVEVEIEAPYRVSCDCGDPQMFKTAFDCNYHLPKEFRPVPNLLHCNYLFQRRETMFRCQTCHLVEGGEDVEEDDDEISSSVMYLGDVHDLIENEGNSESDSGLDLPRSSILSDVWICSRCFVQEDHNGHEIEELINERNEGLYCHCGDPTVLRHPPPAADSAHGSIGNAAPFRAVECRDDHNRQNVLCTTDVKEGMFYYKCKTCQTDPSRIFCEPCFVKAAHESHCFQRFTAAAGFEPTRCGCGENSAFRFATHCQQHERAGGTNIVSRCHYRASAGEWIAICSDCYPPEDSLVPPYLCLRCRQGSDHTDHDIEWIRVEQDLLHSCACGSHSLTRLDSASSSMSPDVETLTPLTGDTFTPNGAASSFSSSLSYSSPLLASGDHATLIHPPPLCQYHTMIYKTTPSTTLYLHSHNYRSINHQDNNEVTGYRYHDSDNGWIVSRPESITFQSAKAESGMGNGADARQNQLSPYLQWKDVFWLQHANTGKYFNSMASLKISQGFQEVSALGGPHSNNDWIIEETTWLRQQILSDE